MADNSSILAALKGVPPDAMPFGVGGPAEPAVEAPGLIGALTSGLLNVPKHLIDSSKQAVPGLRREDYTDNPNAPQPNAPLYGAAADAAMMLAGTGAPAAEAGAAGIFGGKLAKTADIDKLIFANKMRQEGRMPPDILNETGWFKSPTDMKWKFEIPDNNSRMLSHGLDYSKEGTFVGGPTEAMLQHPELYKAYPELKNSTMYNSVLQKPPNNFGRGSWMPERRVAEIEAPNIKNARSVALHELQHGVQDIESFAPGGNPRGMAYLQEKKPQKLPMWEQKGDPNDIYQRLAGEVESRNVQARADFPPHVREAISPWASQDTPFRDQLVFDPRTELVRALRYQK